MAATKTKEAPGLAPPAPGLRPRRPVVRSMVAAGVAVMVGCGLVGYVVYDRGYARTSVLRVRSGLGTGEVLTASDLEAVAFPASLAGGYVPASEEAGVLGARAAAPIASGSLLVPGALTRTPILAPGQVVVSVVLPSSSAVPLGAAVGSRVDVLFAPNSSAARPLAGPPLAEATVVGLGQAASGSGQLVYLAVAASAASAVAQAGASSAAVLSLVP